MMLNRRLLFAGASGLLVAGCADVVGPPPAPRLFVLKPALPGVQGGARLAWTVAVEMPDATAGLDTERIAITRPPSGLDYFAGAAWADRLPALVEADLAEAFEASGRIAAVARNSEGATADVLLSTDLRDFDARYDQGEGAPLAVVRIGVRLIGAQSRKIVATAVFAKQVRASVNSLDAAVDALTGAFTGVLAEMVPWVLAQQVPR